MMGSKHPVILLIEAAKLAADTTDDPKILKEVINGLCDNLYLAQNLCETLDLKNKVLEMQLDIARNPKSKDGRLS